MTFIFLILVATGWIPPESQICHYNDYKGENACATHNTIYVIFVRSRAFVNSLAPAIEAVATIFVAGFTWTLWQSTNRLWKEAERQSQHSASAVRAAEDTAKATLMSIRRPWIHVWNLVNYTTDTDSNRELRNVRLSMTNLGDAPAIVSVAKAILFYSLGTENEEAFKKNTGRPVPSNFEIFPRPDDIISFIFRKGRDAQEETGEPHPWGERFGPFAPALPEGNFVIPGGGTKELFFAANRRIDVTGKDGIPMEYAGHLYLMGFIMYATPLHEGYVAQTFTFRAIDVVGDFFPFGAKPFNNRDYIVPKEARPEE